MPTTKKTFLAGKMDLDSDERTNQNNGESLNIRIANSEGSDVGAIEKSLSNKQLTYLSLGSNVYTLGSLRDEFEEKIYWAVLSDNGCYIIEYEVGTDTTTFVLQDTRAGVLNVLGFVPDKLLQMVLIVDTDNGSRLLGFTDDNTQPKLINIERSKGYAINGFDEEDILLIKKPPLNAPTISLSITPDKENNIKEKFIQFSHRYKYLDGQYSALSPFSKFAFGAKSFAYDYNTGTNTSMVNIYNTVDISFNTGSKLVTDVEVVFKESGSNSVYSIETLNKSDNGWNLTTPETRTLDFTNSKIYKVLAEKELYRLYDNVPLLAKSLAVINNRIVFGNYTENYNIVDALDVKIPIDITATKQTTAVIENVPTQSLKSNRDYEVAISYADDYGRSTTPLVSLLNTVHIPNSDSVNKAVIQMRVANKPPAFAKYFRFFIKQNRIDYNTLLPSLFYEDGIYRWIKLEKSDIDKIKEGDYLVVKADSASILTNLVKTKVLEIKEQEQNFLEPKDSTTEILQKAGTYYKIQPFGFGVNKADYYNYYLETYHNSRARYENCLRSGTKVTYPAVFYGDLLDDMTVNSTNTLGTNVAKRFVVIIDSLQTSAKGTVTLTGGASGSVDTITVNGVNILSAVVPYNVSGLNQTAQDVAFNINANTSSPNYTAIAVGAVITITSVTAGTSVNGFVVVANTTTLTTTTANMSGGTKNTFKWSSDNGDTFTSNIPITAGVGQSLGNGVIVTFGADTGHSTTDEWNFYACGNLLSVDSRAYGWYRTVGDYDNRLTDEGLTVADEVIENGAVIDLGYDEYGNKLFRWEISKTSNSQYDNIMEWWFRNEAELLLDIEANTSITTGASVFNKDNVFFMRCVLGHQEDNAEYAQYNTDGFMTMIIKSQNPQDIDWIKLVAKTKIFQSSGTRLVLETDPKTINEDIFYEIGQTYNITGGYHIGNGGSDINQSLGVNAQIILPFYNCWSWGNAVESYKIRDEFNARSMKLDTRPSTPIENYRQNKRIATFTWSNVYEQSTNYNALNEFNLALVNYKDLDDKYGSIQAMESLDTDLDVYQEDKVSRILFDTIQIFNQDGSSNLSKTDKLFDGVIPHVGEYGISTSPESLVIYGNYSYWADPKRGVFLRKGQSGIEVISNFGMRSWTRDEMISLSTFILGGYDPYFGQFILSLNGKTVTFDEKVKGFTSFHSWIPDNIQRVNNRLYTIKDGQLYLHNDKTNPIVNTFYGTKYASKVVTFLNEAPSEDKIIKNIIQESTKPWKTTIETNLTNGVINADEFDNRESKWIAHTRKNENASDVTDRIQGIGNILSSSGTNITFSQLPTLISVGELLYQDNVGVQEQIGVITAINRTTNVITVNSVITTPVNALFAYSLKDARIQGSELRGYYAKLTLENDDDENVELFAVNANIIQSFIPTEFK